MSTTSTELLDAINAKILDCINNPKFDYKIGEKKVSWQYYLEFLTKQKTSILASQDVDIDTFTFEGFDTNEFGITS